jgi:hypothetical protein
MRRWVRPSRAVRTAVACGVLVVLAACGSGSDQPSAGPPTQFSPSPVKQEDRDEAAAERAVDAYGALTKDALSARRADLPIRRVRTVVAEPYATRLARRLATEHSAGLVMRGTERYTTREVTVQGDRATVVTCWDPTEADIVNTFAKPVQKVRPAPPTETTFLLERADDGWKITERRPGTTC